jgi:hypothetical protein
MVSRLRKSGGPESCVGTLSQGLHDAAMIAANWDGRRSGRVPHRQNRTGGVKAIGLCWADQPGLVSLAGPVDNASEQR